MCDSWKKPSQDELTLEEITRIITQMPKLDAVRLSGGEPFVRGDLLEIADLIQGNLRPHFLHVTTNGLLPERIVRFCRQRRKGVPLHLLISVDGFEDKHDLIRGVPSAWEKVNETIRTLAPERKDLRLSISVNQTLVDPEGVEHFKLLKEHFRPLKIPVYAVMAYDASATYNREQEINLAPLEIGQFPTFGRFSHADLKELFNAVDEEARRQTFPVRLSKRYYWSGIRNRLLASESEPNPKCVALGSHMRIFPDGKIPTCQFNTTAVGDLRQASFPAIWLGRKARLQRDWVERCPGCWAECEVIPNAVYSGDLLRKALSFRSC
jgi:MoaA/NifB/PqqE/SkfB family radical SAM enzyme